MVKEATITVPSVAAIRIIAEGRHLEEEVRDLEEEIKKRVEWARRQGQDQERERIFQIFHDKVSSKLLAAVFSAQMAKEDLEAKGLKESEMIAKIGDKIVEAIEGLVAILDPAEPVEAGEWNADVFLDERPHPQIPPLREREPVLIPESRA